MVNQVVKVVSQVTKVVFLFFSYFLRFSFFPSLAATGVAFSSLRGGEMSGGAKEGAMYRLVS